jgi:hypothetical protein
MKKLLYILLISFGFSATAQNASTIQQLLDEGVTIGELLDSGVSVDEFYGLNYEDGIIFDIDSTTGNGRVAYNPETSKSFQSSINCNEGCTYPSLIPVGEVPTTDASFDDNNGLQNTINIASSCPGSSIGASFALNFISENGYSNWYLPTKNEAELIFNNLTLDYKIEDWPSFIMTSEIYMGFGYWDADIGYRENANDSTVLFYDLPRNNSCSVIIVREIDLIESSQKVILEFNNAESLSSQIPENYSFNNLYGLIYEDGYLFDIDTINNIGKIAIYQSNLGFQDKYFQGPADCNDWPCTYPSLIPEGEVPTSDASFDDNNGLQNTINIASSSSAVITASSFALNHRSENGYSNWYLPTKKEAELIFNNLKQNFRIEDWPTEIMTSEVYMEFGYWGADISFGSSVADSTITFSDFPRYQTRNFILVREFDLTSPTVDELSQALESFLETYIPPVVEEEEVVSDANSFDVLNPLSYNGDFEAVHFELTTDFNYEVPSGKTLLINQSYSYQEPIVYINNICVTTFDAYNSSDRGAQKVLTLSSGDILSLTASNPNAKVYVHGLLINKVIPTIHFELTTNSNYEVPSGKTLIINQSFSYQNPTVYINDIKVTTFDVTTSTGRVLQQMLVSGSGDILALTSSNANAKVYVHGILIDNSNYTYATDYELIDALNEGMDSLSTISEVVVQENDSLTTENAILSEENEALMLIEYNYDSLQYVTEYLYSQVFDLQQELLVPNIDVDMAIGWNMIGFSCPEEKGATDALIDIVDEILIMKDNNGSVYMPEFGFNGIGDLTPGHGYQLKVTDYILDFNICE